MQSIEWPFRAAEALAAGALTFRELRRFHAGVYPGVWAPRDVELSADQRARAAWLWSGRDGVLAGLSASSMLGAKWMEPGTPAELVHTNRRPPPLIVVHTDALLPGETKTVCGMPATTAARTAFDLGRRLGLKEGVQRIDALMNATDVKVRTAIVGRGAIRQAPRTGLVRRQIDRWDAAQRSAGVSRSRGRRPRRSRLPEDVVANR